MTVASAAGRDSERRESAAAGRAVLGPTPCSSHLARWETRESGLG